MDEQINEWIGTEDAERIFGELMFSLLRHSTKDEILNFPSDKQTNLLIAYAYKCGRMDERNK